MSVERPKFVQARTTTLSSPITDAEVLSVVLARLVDLYGNPIIMENFWSTAYMVLEPGSDNEEIISFTNFTRNDDDTVNIDTDIVRGVAGLYPYDNSGTPRNHAAGSVVIFSNSPSVYESILAYVEDVALSGAPNASLTTKGVVESATTEEINSGDSNGDTGADLSVRPDQLAASIYNVQLPTANEKAAIAGTSGTPVTGANPLVDLAYLNGQNITPSGAIISYGGFSAPAGWLLADGSAVSRATYANLWGILNPSLGKVTMTIASPGVVTSTSHGLVAGDAIYFTNAGNKVVTITIASPGVVTLANHGLVAGDMVVFSTTSSLPTGITAGTQYFVTSVGLTANTFHISTSSGGADVNTSGSQSGVQTLVGSLPTGVTANTIYYVISGGLTTNAFEFSATKGGSAVNTSGTQSGVQTLLRSPFGLGDGSTTFNVPDLRQRTPTGIKSGDTYVPVMGSSGGEQTHTLTVGELATHHHNIVFGNTPGGGAGVAGFTGNWTASSNQNTDDTGSSTPHNNLSPFIAVNYIIKA